jgi:sulfhydrogenase subunit beta (sulfur reductase)
LQKQGKIKIMLVIEKEKINEWVKELAKKTPVSAPIRREEQGAVESIFEKFDVDNPPTGGIDFDYLPTLRSVKEFFFPAKEEIFTYNKSRGKVGIPAKAARFILFGLNSADLEALTQLDEIMAKPNEDFFYFQKRNAATIIGLINKPVSAERRTSGGDLILIKINENQYEAVPLTEKGKILAKNKLFKKETAAVTTSASESPEIMPQLRQLLLDPELISDALSWSWKNDSAVWDELASLCLGCGICTYVCPLCYCFLIEDKTSLDGKISTRCRVWDACTLPKFSQISGGFNFHKTIKERYHNWHFHKFVRAYKEYGKSQCVACGRCQKYCPAKIDIEKYLVRIVDDYKKAIANK